MSPQESQALLQSANAAHVAGKLAEAERLVEKVLQGDPANIHAHLLKGVLAGKTGRSEVALRHLQRVVNANPESFEGLFWLSVIHRREGRLAEALGYARQAAVIRPQDAFSLNNLGLCLMDSVLLEDAARAFEQAVRVRADMAPIFHNLGTVLHQLGRDEEAALAFGSAIRLAPRSVESRLGLGQVLISLSKPVQAANEARQALAVDPKSAPAHLLLANALVEDGKPDESESHVKMALALNPNDAQVQALAGQRLQTAGRFEEANAHLRKSIALQAKQGFAYFALAHNNRITDEDRPMLAEMESLVAGSGLPPRELSYLYYGLGRSYEALGEYETAMSNFDQANILARKIKLKDKPFDRTAYRRDFESIVSTFTKDLFAKNLNIGNPSALPVFIVGMMRSGTTLAEQILSAHPDIAGGGEQPFWPVNGPKVFTLGQLADSKAVSTLTAEYLKTLSALASGAPHITDKMPANYEWLGLFHLALPNARILHMKRHPVDTCISIYTTPNRIPISYAHDRENIVFAYEQYLRLMQHWRSVLPANRFLEVSYESLVGNKDQEVARILEFIGVDPSRATVTHEGNNRQVVTPSQWQVRQPIYNTSLERWRRYEPWLGAFSKLL